MIRFKRSAFGSALAFAYLGVPPAPAPRPAPAQPPRCGAAER